MLKIEYIFEHTEYCTEISRRTCEVSHRQLYDIIDDVDTCWRELGPKLNISEVDVQKLDEEFPYNRNKAMTLLFMWKEREGRRAVAGLLADALLSIGRKDIAEKLLGEYSLIVSVCMFSVPFNRSLRSIAPIFASNDKPDNESAARIQGEASHNCEYYLMFRRRVMRIASFTQRLQ